MMSQTSALSRYPECRSEDAAVQMQPGWTDLHRDSAALLEPQRLKLVPHTIGYSLLEKQSHESFLVISSKWR